jgi:hypothetical protein
MLAAGVAVATLGRVPTVVHPPRDLAPYRV